MTNASLIKFVKRGQKRDAAARMALLGTNKPCFDRPHPYRPLFSSLPAEILEELEGLV